jgi:hypothetical protein
MFTKFSNLLLQANDLRVSIGDAVTSELLSRVGFGCVGPFNTQLVTATQTPVFTALLAQKTSLPTSLSLFYACLLLNYASGIVTCLLTCCQGTGMSAEPFPGNGDLCWLHRSCIQQICHNILDATLRIHQ